ncbi:receptor-type tyrosine-protein phosphatase eta isoform X2 [Heterocephalus glaber]|uniref:Receptor-type tyrosine-protein phosphatase eta n=1 Tax=Heterocephalus glaber TaxID=10181 RepID=A0AAX6TIP3_HETGA|nr:receptor-type tyrosine-protein phosphatase eta isoform X2 [Heterocephalus glaber]
MDPGLRGALLLLLRLGQLLCVPEALAAVSGAPLTTTNVSTTAMIWMLGSDGPVTDPTVRATEGAGEAWQSRPTLGTSASPVTLAPTPGRAEGTSPTADSSVFEAPGVVSDIEVLSIRPTSVVLMWEKENPGTSEFWYRIEEERSNTSVSTQQTRYNVTGLRPATAYTFSISLGRDNKTWGKPTSKNVTTEPLPVWGLHVAFMGQTQVVLIWGSDNGTASCRLLLETVGSPETPTNISDLQPGFQRVVLSLPWLDETQSETRVMASSSDSGGAVSGPGSPAQPSSSLSVPADRILYRLEHTGPASGPETGDTEVLISGLKLDTQYSATVYPRAADGTEGQPRDVDFRTNSEQVFDIRAVNINATSLSLTWKMRHNGSSSAYTYEIHVAGDTESFNLTTDETRADILGLNSRTLYHVTVCPLLRGAEGTPGFLQVYTTPFPVSDLRVTKVGPREIGLAWHSSDSKSFKIVTTGDGSGEFHSHTASSPEILIRGLKPATNYCFKVFPQGPNGTVGEPTGICNQTASSAVFGLRVVTVTSTGMELEWQNTDPASEYIYRVLVQSAFNSSESNSSQRAVSLGGLTPGTHYTVSIYPEADQLWGDPGTITQYTRPSDVSNIAVSVNTTAANLSWQNDDVASPTYTYHLLIEKAGDASDAPRDITNITAMQEMVPGLEPGSPYTVKIFAEVGGVESLVPGQKSFCTESAPVDSFHCAAVPREPSLVLTWEPPPGGHTGFQLGLGSEAWDNVTCLGLGSLDNGTNCRAEVSNLNFSTLYNISMATLSCGATAAATHSTCLTGITDPPAPDGSPNITSVSHNSVRVKFSGFEASHGPIKAYAIVLTTGEAGRPSPDVLRYTYDDFKKGNSDTYVTYLIHTEEKARSQGGSGVLKYEINIGNESTTLGYYNGKLEPLGSYRACVAGFTNITFNLQHGGLINGAESYVSFSPYSEAVFLPQDPGVICGAVFGCIFGALVIVAVGGFIFWRKKRKDGKNNDVSFSQIKPKKSKLIRVEHFEAHFKKQQADSNCGFAEEYEDLKLVGISLPKYAAELAENRGKNRYNNVLPYDTSRVKLSVQTHSTDDYINANYMPGYHSKRDFIATQGPLPNTLKDFWRMVWEKDVYAIVMLTKCVEQGRTKCEEYWPSKQAQDYGGITVAMTSEIVLPEWSIRDFTVRNVQTSDSHRLRQFHFTSWPDHGVPDTTDLLINFRYLVRDYMKQSPPESPILVHCSAGVGRTGTFIAIDRLIYQIENENTVDVYGIVYDLRMHRPLMVQTEDQYVFLNQCVLDIVRSERDPKADLIYQNTTAMTIYENLEPVGAFGKTNGYIA